MSPAAADLESLPAYCTILAQCLSPSAPGAGGEQDSHLAVAEEKSGRVEVLALEDLVSRDAKGSSSGSCVKPRASLKTGAPALAMCSVADRDLVVGSVGHLLAYRWSDLTGPRSSKKDQPEVAWRVRLAPEAGGGGGVLEEVDANCLEEVRDGGDSPAGRVAVGGGDGVVRVVDVETGAVVEKAEAHADFVHGVSCCPQSGLIASAGEDGTVCLWDRRMPATSGRGRKASSNLKKLTPNSHKSLERPALGKWVGAVSLSGDWLVCGGGPRAALWHLRTLAPGEPFRACAGEDAAVHAAGFVSSDRIFVAGAAGKLRQLSMSTGDALSEVSLSSSRCYSVAAREGPPFDFLSCAGSSSRIDICSPSLSYKDRTVTCFSSK